MVKLKRVYEKPDPKDGVRILVERLWPRGVSKAAAEISLWMKEIAPSTELRKWFNHDPKKWPEFQKRYREELQQQKELIEQLRKNAKTTTLTLVFAARDVERNSAVVLRDVIEGR